MNRSRRLRLSELARVLRARVTATAYLGLLIAAAAVLVATMADARLLCGSFSLAALVMAQTENPCLWVLDGMPFAFLLWGQYVGVLLSNEAGAMLLDETEGLRGDNAALAAKVQHSLKIDPLTGLINRTHFLESLEAVIDAAARAQTRIGLIVVDLDGFSEVNDRYGSAIGDQVLLSLARRLKRVAPAAGALARLHADRFGILVSPLTSTRQLEDIAARIKAAIEPPCALDGLSLTLAASAGGARYPDNATDAYALLDAANQAMQQVKMRGDGFGLLWSRRVVSGVSMLSLSAELRRAIDLDEFVLHFQPLVDVGAATTCGLEALIRWQHPRRGLIMPDEFIGRAERSGLMHDLTLWVLRHAIAQLAAWRRDSLALTVSVNVSARSLLRADFPDALAALLAQHEVPAAALTVEITENTLMTDQHRTRETVARLAAMGAQISIDDFGTGYSQLAYLKDLPAAEIKIDRSFIEDLLTSDTDSAIVAATIRLAHALGLRAVGEGVEHAEQWTRLAALGCDLVQGFYFGRPMPAAAVSEWLERYPAAAVAPAS